MNEQQQFQQPQTPPPNYLVFAILTTIFCCQILGIVSIVFAAQVNSRWNSGDIQGALDASKNAKLWAWIAFGSGFLIAIVTVILAMLGVLAGIFGGMNF
ncbi:MAG: CD225/dispanin family protein [Draconibacterium sp.]|nr:CD225/dispanin family protein [Draconibacterium sp.]